MTPAATVPHMPVDVAPLVARVQAGDPAAETELAERFGPRMRALCLARTRRPDLAADLAQDAMIALLLELRRGSLRDPAALPAFAAGIARNVVRAEHRVLTRQDPRPRHHDVAQGGDPATDAGRMDVERALARLPAGDQHLLQLILVQGCKLADLARRLGVPADAARTRMLRAQQRLTEVFGSLPPSRSAASASRTTQ